MSPSQQERSETARQEILEAARKAFVAKGYRATTLREISRLSGRSIGCIYHHFRDKDELISEILSGEALVSWFIEAYRVALSDEFPDNLEEIGLAIKEGVERNTDSIKLVIWDSLEYSGEHFHRIFENQDSVIDVLFEKMEDRLRQAGLPEDINPRIPIYVVFNTFFDFYIHKLLFGADLPFGITDEDAIHQIADLFQRFQFERD